LNSDFKKFLPRYSKQILFFSVGEISQKKINQGKVAIIGCGGLGSVIANNLTRAGIGFLRLIDNDKLELSNLQRQFLFDENDVKKNLFKVMAAKKRLMQINSEVEIESLIERVNAGNIDRLINNVDLVLDGTDNMETRFLINEACIRNNIPWIYGAVAASYGMVLDIIPGNKLCFRCVFEGISSAGITLSCDTVGIINPAVNVVASVQTAEALKILTGNKNQLIKGLAVIDVWDLSLQIINIDKSKSLKCPVCNQDPIKP